MKSYDPQYLIDSAAYVDEQLALALELFKIDPDEAIASIREARHRNANLQGVLQSIKDEADNG